MTDNLYMSTSRVAYSVRSWREGQFGAARKLLVTVEGVLIRRLAPAVEHTPSALLIGFGIRCEVSIRQVSARVSGVLPSLLGLPSRRDVDRLRERVQALEFEVESKSVNGFRGPRW